jgi:hypothetical protein
MIHFAAQRSKYGAKPAEQDGLTFDSFAELRRYQELLLLLAAGEITDLRVHPRYTLLEAFTDARGRKHRALAYEGDFEYFEVSSGLTVIEDVKGMETREFRIKEKLLCKQLPAGTEFRVVKT